MGSLKSFYAVKVGRQTGIFNTWEECKEQINGFSGAKFKGFFTKEEAETFLRGSKQIKCEAYAYTDGSFNEKYRTTGGGGVIYHNGKEYPFIIVANEKDFSAMQNVGGEILAAIGAIKYAEILGINSLHIYHDYEGVGAWAKGEWKANKTATKGYVRFINDSDIITEFTRVNAHTGIEENEKADLIAKYSVGLANEIGYNNIAVIDFKIEQGKYFFEISQEQTRQTQSLEI